MSSKVTIDSWERSTWRENYKLVKWRNRKNESSLSCNRISENRSHWNIEILCGKIWFIELILSLVRKWAIENTIGSRLERTVLQASNTNGLGRVIPNCKKEIIWKGNSSESEVHTRCIKKIGRVFYFES